MSPEVCPFCGKTYKRLKSHLPHCKAAASSETPPADHNVTLNRTSSSQLAEALTKSPAKGSKSIQTQSKKQSKKLTAVSAAAAPLHSESTSSPSQSSLPSSASPPPSTKKKKPKLSEQIEAVALPSSAPTQSQSPSLSPTIAKPKKKSVRALIEAAKTQNVFEGSPEATRSASEDLPSGSTLFVSDPRSSRTTTQSESRINLEKDNTHPALLSTDTKPRGVSKVKVSKTKKAAQSPSATRDSPVTLDSEANEGGARKLQEMTDLSVNKMLESGSGQQARITLQNVKATLGRANATHQSSRPSILSQFGSTDRSSKISPSTCLSLVPFPTANNGDQLSATSSKHMELESVKTQGSTITLHPRSERTSATALPPGHLSSHLSQTMSPQHAVHASEGLRVGHHMTGLPAKSPLRNQISSSHFLPLAPKMVSAREGLTTEKSQLWVRTENSADNGTKGALAQQNLGQVRLKDLPEWLMGKTPKHPRDVMKMVQKGWQWYYRRYIDVKKGGVGGAGMLLAGYCVLSYIWSYPHIKHYRWRKHH